MSTNGDAITGSSRSERRDDRCHKPCHEGARERLIRRGAGALSDAELLSLVMRSRRDADGLALAHRLLARFGAVGAVLAARPAQLLEVVGTNRANRARASALAAVLELAERATAMPIERTPVFGASSDVSRFLRMRLGRCRREVFGVLFLDSQHRLIEYRALFFGTVDSATVHPREVLRAAMDLDAAAVILAHNHPSGVAEPSRADVALTERLRSVLSLVDIRVLDHLVVVPNGTVSLAERGLL